MNLTEHALQILEAGESKAVAVIKRRDGNIIAKNVRLGRSDSGPLIMKGGSRKYGYPVINIEGLLEIRAIKKRAVDPAEKWEKQIRRVIALLEESGLWPEVRETLLTGLEIGYAKLRTIEGITNNYGNGETWDEKIARQVKEAKAIEPRIIKARDDGSEYIDTELIWHWLSPKIKKMHFGKASTGYLQRIADSLGKREETTLRWRPVFPEKGYDVSFEYKPESRKAWYSEEYRGCGNGYYYLALNATHAIFYEKD
jgi:hypothetical protein